MLPSQYRVTDQQGSESVLSLRHAFFNPGYISGNGISGIIRGQARHAQQRLDRFIVDDVRNFLFGPGFGGLDLASLNIQRGRDHGLPSYNAVRFALGLAPARQFSDVVGRRFLSAQALESAYGYGNVDSVDLWTGGLSEPLLPGTSLGETFTIIFVDQFTRLRDGDRFYFENPDIYPRKFINGILNTTLADIIRRNTGIRSNELNSLVFFLPGQRLYQPDLTIGAKRNQLTHLGDDRYNRSGAGQKIRVRSATRSWATSFASLENDGPYLSAIKVTTREPSRRKYMTRYLELGNNGRRNVTTDLVLGRYGWHLAPSETVTLKARVRLQKRIGISRAGTNLSLRAESLEDNKAIDAVESRVSFR